MIKATESGVLTDDCVNVLFCLFQTLLGFPKLQYVVSFQESEYIHSVAMLDCFSDPFHILFCWSSRIIRSEDTNNRIILDISLCDRHVKLPT